jgi:hypothetical protein
MPATSHRSCSHDPGRAPGAAPRQAASAQSDPSAAGPAHPAPPTRWATAVAALIVLHAPDLQRAVLVRAGRRGAIAGDERSCDIRSRHTRWRDYERELEPRLAALHDRVHGGAVTVTNPRPSELVATSLRVSSSLAPPSRL